MEPEIRPEPSPEERAAILAAAEGLREDDTRPAAYRSVWRAAGVRENVNDSEDD